MRACIASPPFAAPVCTVILHLAWGECNRPCTQAAHRMCFAQGGAQLATVMHRSATERAQRRHGLTCGDCRHWAAATGMPSCGAQLLNHGVPVDTLPHLLHGRICFCCAVRHARPLRDHCGRARRRLLSRQRAQPARARAGMTPAAGAPARRVCDVGSAEAQHMATKLRRHEWLHGGGETGSDTLARRSCAQQHLT